MGFFLVQMENLEHLGLVDTRKSDNVLGAAVRMRGTAAASPRTQLPRSRSINHGLARYRLTTNGRSKTWGRVRMPRSDGPKWNKN